MGVLKGKWFRVQVCSRNNEKIYMPGKEVFDLTGEADHNGPWCGTVKTEG